MNKFKNNLLCLLFGHVIDRPFDMEGSDQKGFLITCSRCEQFRLIKDFPALGWLLKEHGGQTKSD